MSELVDLAVVKLHLRAPSTTAEDELITLYAAQAQEIVLNYITRVDDEDQATLIASWDEDTVPASIQAAILKQTMELYRFRGDDTDEPTRGNGEIAPAVVAILAAAGYRRPVVAS